MIHHFPHSKCQRCDIWCDIFWNWTITTKKISMHNPQTNSGFLCKCPRWDISPRSPFVSMKDTQIILKFAKCRPPCEGRGIMDYGILWLGPTLSHHTVTVLNKNKINKYKQINMKQNIWVCLHEYSVPLLFVYLRMINKTIIIHTYISIKIHKNQHTTVHMTNRL